MIEILMKKMKIFKNFFKKVDHFFKIFLQKWLFLLGFQAFLSYCARWDRSPGDTLSFGVPVSFKKFEAPLSFGVPVSFLGQQGHFVHLCVRKSFYNLKRCIFFQTFQFHLIFLNIFNNINLNKKFNINYKKCLQKLKQI